MYYAYTPSGLLKEARPYPDLAAVTPNADGLILMWGACFLQNEPTSKILRNIPPVHLLLEVQQVPNPWIENMFRTEVTAYDYAAHLRGKRKEVNLVSRNNHGDFFLANTYQECAQMYNAHLIEARQRAEFVLQRDTAELKSRIEFLNQALIPGHVAIEGDPS